MNRKIDSVVKQAKQSRKQRAQRNLSTAPTLQSILRAREQKEDSLKVWGPYTEGEARFRLKVAENGIEKSLLFRTLEEAEELKEDLLQKYVKATRKTVAEARFEWIEELSQTVRHAPETHWKKPHDMRVPFERTISLFFWSHCVGVGMHCLLSALHTAVASSQPT